MRAGLGAKSGGAKELARSKRLKARHFPNQSEKSEVTVKIATASWGRLVVLRHDRFYYNSVIEPGLYLSTVVNRYAKHQFKDYDYESICWKEKENTKQ